MLIGCESIFGVSISDFCWLNLAIHKNTLAKVGQLTVNYETVSSFLTVVHSALETSHELRPLNKAKIYQRAEQDHVFS